MVLHQSARGIGRGGWLSQRASHANMPISAFAHGQEDADENQADADVVKVLRLFSEEDGREQGAKNRHQMDEEAGPTGTDFGDTAVVKNVADETGENSDISQRGERSCVRVNRVALRHFPEIGR